MMKIMIIIFICTLPMIANIKQSYCSDALLWIERWEREEKDKREKEEIKLEAKWKLPPGYHVFNPKKTDELDERKKMLRWWRSLPPEKRQDITKKRLNYLDRTRKLKYGY